MMNTISITKLILSILAFIAVVILVVFALQRVDKYLDLKAREDCATAYHLEYTDAAGNTKVIRPVEDLYQQCLAQKGIK